MFAPDTCWHTFRLLAHQPAHKEASTMKVLMDREAFELAVHDGPS